MSSDAVYGDIDKPFDEQWATNPIGAYGRMKAEVEKYFIGHHNVKILRSSYNFFRRSIYFLPGEVCIVWGDSRGILSIQKVSYSLG